MARRGRVPRTGRGRGSSGGCARRRRPKMRMHEISVTIDEDRIEVAPDPLTMFKADEVQWAGTNARKFSIEFDGDGPFGISRLEHAMATGKNRPNANGH